MIDHVGFSVSDYPRAKAFYERALAPLGYKLVMEVTAQATGQPAAGFGSGGKPDFWIGGEGKLEKPVHIAIAANDRAISPEQEKATAERMGAKTITLTTSHLPMLSQPQKVADFVIEAAASFG